MEHKLQIQFITQKNVLLRELFTQESPKVIQAKSFEIGFLIKNIGSAPIKGFSIKNIIWKAEANSQRIIEDFFREFHIDTINPDEEKRIWVGKSGTFSHGLHTIGLTIVPDTQSDRINTFQLNYFTKECIATDSVNKWLDYFYIYTKNEDEQSKSNKLLLWLTIILVITTTIQFFISYRYQIQPEIYKMEADNLQAKNVCLSNSNDSVLLDGKLTTCLVFLKLQGISTTTNQ